MSAPLSKAQRSARARAAKILAEDPTYYRRLGQKGGRVSKRSGFAADPERAVKAGQVGGKKGRRQPGDKGTATHCFRGHERTEANTKWVTGRNGRQTRQCLRCTVITRRLRELKRELDVMSDLMETV